MRLAAAAIAALLTALLAQSAMAAGFERGDVLASVGNPSVIGRFAPDGTFRGSLADSAGAGPLCFDPSSEHLIAPGTGLYDSTGARLASAWDAVTPRGACTVDTAGNVYLAGAPSTGDRFTGRGTIRKFDLTGHPLASYDVDATGITYGRQVMSVDLAPDQCTIYYNLDGGEDVKRYDVCTGTQRPTFGSAGFPCDQLRVRPNGEVVVTCDTYGRVLDASGAGTTTFANPTDPLSNSLRLAALDPDGTSFWMGNYGGQLARFDIASGQRLDRWSIAAAVGGIAVYSPPQSPAPSTGSETQQNTEDTGAGALAQDPAAALGVAIQSSAPSLAAPAFIVAHGRLRTSGRSLLLDTGLSATCPAAGPPCHASVTLTVAGAGARTAAARVAPIGTLSTGIAPGAQRKLVVRLSRTGAALVRKRRAVTISARVSIRAGGGPAVVRKTSVRVELRRPR